MKYAIGGIPKANEIPCVLILNEKKIDAKLESVHIEEEVSEEYALQDIGFVKHRRIKRIYTVYEEFAE